jgi:hypothetical protein
MWAHPLLVQKELGRHNPTKSVAKTEDVSVRHCLRARARNQRHEIVERERRSRRKNACSIVTRKMHKYSTGTDGRPMISKTTSMTGRQEQPLFLFEKTLLHRLSMLEQKWLFHFCHTRRRHGIQ